MTCQQGDTPSCLDSPTSPCLPWLLSHVLSWSAPISKTVDFEFCSSWFTSHRHLLQVYRGLPFLVLLLIGAESRGAVICFCDGVECLLCSWIRGFVAVFSGFEVIIDGIVLIGFRVLIVRFSLKVLSPWFTFQLNSLAALS